MLRVEVAHGIPRTQRPRLDNRQNKLRNTPHYPRYPLNHACLLAHLALSSRSSSLQTPDLLPPRWLLDPLQIMLAPGIHESHHQNGEKDNHLPENKRPSTFEHDGPGEHKDCFNIKDEKD